MNDEIHVQPATPKTPPMSPTPVYTVVIRHRSRLRRKEMHDNVIFVNVDRGVLQITPMRGASLIYPLDALSSVEVEVVGETLVPTPPSQQPSPQRGFTS